MVTIARCFGLWLGTVALCAVGGCEDSRKPSGLTDVPSEGTSGRSGRTPADWCATPQTGCECEEGAVADCGQVSEMHDDYVTCSMGERSCTDGTWSKCETEREEQIENTPESSRFRIAALGSSATCPADFDPCDPYCRQTVDTPGDSGAGGNFSDSSGGLKLAASAATGCGTLTVAASSPTITVTQISPIVATPVTLTATLNPACVTAPFNVVWTIDRFDLAQVTGSNSSNGSLTALRPYAGNVIVKAYAVGLSGSTTVAIKVNVAASPTTNTAAAPNKAASSTQISGLAGTGSGNSVTWLYPYANTFFPLGLPAPTLQYSYSSGAGGAVKATLRYPANATAASATFNYALIVKEENTVSQTAGVALNATSPQITIPAAAWSAFEQSARGNDADLLVQRISAGGTVETETRRKIRLVNAQLKGTVFYNSYSSQLGAGTGAVLKINPGATAPTLAIQPSGQCTVCHSVNLDGSKIIASGFRPGGPYNFNQSRRYDMTGGTLPSPTVLNSYNVASTDTENVSGDRFNFGAVWTNGSLYMTHGGSGSTTSGTPIPFGDPNWRSPPDFSRLYDPNNPTVALTVSGWSNISAVTPKFSPDGTKLAFGFWGGNTSTLSCSPSSSASCSSTGKLSAATLGTRLAVADFSCSPSPCTSASSFTVGNARDLTPGVTQRVAWPAISPDNSMVIYQRQYRSSKSLLGWSPSDVNTVAGALAELWVSKVPATSATAAQPLQLKALNGLNADGSSYLPTLSPYHVANGTFTINQADWCGGTASATGVNDYQLNYLPAFSPATSGDHYWAVFTSRRMYGNVATDDPWDAEPGYACNSGVPPTKKLWIAAIDKTWTYPNDPSHPAFYLPGQELKAGNSDGFWVNAACGALATSCTTNDDCCGGTGATPTARCDAVTSKCQAIVACKTATQACTSTADCCSGLICGGSGTCVNPDYYSQQSYQREFVAGCPSGTKVAWRFFEWQATITTGTSIALAVQTRATTTDAYRPTSPLALGSITSSTSGTTWAHGASTVDQVLAAASIPSQDRLLVTMTFNPKSDGSTTPELDAWRIEYDCKPAE